MNESSREAASPRRPQDEKEMPFLDHLEELRARIFKSLLAICLFALVSLVYIDKIFEITVAPYNEAVRVALEDKPELSAQSAPRLVFMSPTGGFMINLKLAATVGLLFSLPVIFFQIWKFISPGLLASERRAAPLIVFFTTLCFVCGGAFCYFVVLKYGLGFLLSFQSATLVPMISIDEYFGFVTTLILVFGLVFEMPVIAYFLTRIGILTPEFLRQKRRYGIVAIFVIAAVVTPSVDAFTQILLAVPLLFLYEISIWVSRLALPEKMKKALGEVATEP
ncbi:twin-arginine translocase subunit TatC [candidate division KSB1 bacterium]|nr:twin-arginine translocase subunit TatC [candidate division KSB1 bacterium]